MRGCEPLQALPGKCDMCVEHRADALLLGGWSATKLCDLLEVLEYWLAPRAQCLSLSLSLSLCLQVYAALTTCRTASRFILVPGVPSLGTSVKPVTVFVDKLQNFIA